MTVESLTFKSGITAPRSPVNNCGKLTYGGDIVMTPTPSEQAAAVLSLVESGVIAWDDPEVVSLLSNVASLLREVYEWCHNSLPVVVSVRVRGYWRSFIPELPAA